MASSRLGRRQFLGRAAAMAAPLLIPAASRGDAANSRIGLGIIGVGGMGGGHLGRAVRHPDVQVLAVADVDANRLAAAKARVDAAWAAAHAKSAAAQVCGACHDYREILARSDIDAVLIATPDHWHARICSDAAMAGKDIYCEKPLTLTIGEARHLTRTIPRYGRVFQTGSQQRSEYQGRFRLACELVRSGRIGELRRCHVSVGGPSGDCHLPAEPTPPWLDWDMWLGPAPWRAFSAKIHPAAWRAYRDYSGGGMTDWGAHHFDIVQWALGMDDGGPVAIVPPGVDGAQRLTFRYANGVEVTHGGYQGDGGNGITFVGTEGRIDVNRDALRTSPASLGTAPLGPDDVRLERTAGHFANWLACIGTRRRPICAVEVGARSVTVCHLGNLAYWLKRPLHWDPSTWSLIGDAEASRWLTRPARPPWELA